jgi:hypothetical protein
MGFIDKTGALVIPPQFESTMRFKEGLAPVVIDDKCGFINKNGVSLTRQARSSYRFSMKA